MSQVEAIKHRDRRRNIPTEELRDFVIESEQQPKATKYPRDSSLDPQLIWKGKDEQDLQPLEVPAVPIYIQEKIHPQAIVEDFRRSAPAPSGGRQDNGFPDLFADFNGLDEFDKKVDFYHHDQHWSNRMILGDSLLVMTSLAEKEGLKGKVQTIYFDPPYGIKFGSNWQVSTRKRDVKDGNAQHATRQPEQIRAFRDTWNLGIHSFLPYIRDRLMVSRELLTESGSIFVQIGDENIHLVRNLLDEVFGSDNFVANIAFKKKKMPLGETYIFTMCDYILWYAKDSLRTKFRKLFLPRDSETSGDFNCVDLESGEICSLSECGGKVPAGGRQFQSMDLRSSGRTESCVFDFEFANRKFHPSAGRSWKTNQKGMQRLALSNRLYSPGNSLRVKFYLEEYPVQELSHMWMDTQGATDKVYVVQTPDKVIERCLLMTTDPGDLVLDPTCGSGTTAYVAEQWGRRWITTDTSRVAIALARTRLMTARFPYYLLSDSPEGVKKEAELTGKTAPPYKTDGDIRKGFVYQRVPHVTLKSIANNPDIKEGMTRKQIDEAIARHAETETLYDKPYEDKSRLRVTGPFTVESLSPHRTISVEDKKTMAETGRDGWKVKLIGPSDFSQMILENLKKAGVQNTVKNERLKFDSIEPYPGEWIQGEGRYLVDGGVVDGGSPSAVVNGGLVDGGSPSAPSTIHRSPVTNSAPSTIHPSPVTSPPVTIKRAAICIGPEYGTVGPELVKEAAKEAVRGVGFDLLIVCGFSFDPHVAEESKRYGKLTVLAVRMNPDLSMGDELLKKTGAGNLFMVFGEPDMVVDCDEWMVDRWGKRIARYGQFKRLSGFGSLEAINLAGKGDLSHLRAIAAGGAVRASVADAARGSLDTRQHRRGSGEKLDRGIHAIPGDRARVGGGTGNIAGIGGGTASSAGTSNELGNQKPDDHSQDAFSPDEITAIQNLTPDSFPLSTIHQTQVTLRGIDVYDPTTGAIRSNTTDDIACWFIDTDYNGESFFVRHAYFTGAEEPYEKLKNALRAEIDEAAWSQLYATTSRPFERPKSGKIAVKVINHYGDEVLKVYPLPK